MLSSQTVNATFSVRVIGVKGFGEDTSIPILLLWIARQGLDRQALYVAALGFEMALADLAAMGGKF